MGGSFSVSLIHFFCCLAPFVYSLCILVCSFCLGAFKYYSCLLTKKNVRCLPEKMSDLQLLNSFLLLLSGLELF